MTRKDYVRFAAMLKQQRIANSHGINPAMNHAKDVQWNDFVRAIVDIFEKDNPRFDRTKFLKACGVNS